MSRLVIELTASSLRCLQVEGRGRALRILRFLVDPLLPEEAVGERLSRLIRCDGARSPSVISAIPRDQCITRLMAFPTTDAKELTRMVELSGKTQFPYPPDNTVLDSSVVDQEAGTSTVQLVACHRQLMEQHLGVLRQAGLEPCTITPSSWGVFAWYQGLGRGPDTPEPALIINVDHDHTDLALIRSGCVVWSRIISQGLQEWHDPPEWLSLFLSELERSLAIVRHEWPRLDIRTFVLTGLGPLAQWQEIFEQRLGKPVIVRNAQGDLRVPTVSSDIGVSPVVVVGLALAQEGWLVNLLPQDIRQARARQRWRREAMLTGMLVLVAWMLGVGLLAVHVRRQERLVAHTTSVVKRLESLTERTEQQARNVHLLERVLASRRGTAAMLAELFRLTPGDIVFEHLTFERSRDELVVGGDAPTGHQVLDYLRQLQQSTQWKHVTLRYSGRRHTRTQRRTDFEIVLQHGASS